MKTADKIGNVLDESAIVVSDADVAKVAKMTDQNDHGGARLYIAKNILKDKRFTKIFKLINDIHDLEGYLPHPLGEYRMEATNAMFDVLKQKLSNDDYNRIHGAL